MNDPFDLNKLRVSIDQAQQINRPKRKKWRRQWVRFPWSWVARLQTFKHDGTCLLALLLVYEHWHNGGRPIVLSNILAAEIGLSRHAKRRALAKLEQLGLVAVKWSRSRAPRTRSSAPYNGAAIPAW
jgi:hypothetical protein